MADIVVTAIGPQDRARWAELWRGYLDFYETELPPEIYEHTWQRLIAAESPIRGLGARLGSEEAPLVGIAHYLFHAHALKFAGEEPDPTDAPPAAPAPAPAPAPEPSVSVVHGSAKLRTSQCTVANRAKASVSGTSIASVAFFVDGKKVRTVSSPA